MINRGDSVFVLIGTYLNSEWVPATVLEIIASPVGTAAFRVLLGDNTMVWVNNRAISKYKKVNG